MTAPETLAWLFARQRLGMQLGLERVHALLGAAGQPQRKFRSILVGGTNGKGSTSRALAECLFAAGARTGLFTSPHLSRLGERFWIDGRELPRELVLEALEQGRAAADDQQATFFEILTVAACRLFAREGVEAAVFEVGLGGRFDATNALEPEISLVTGVSLDHTDLLGDDVTAIAGEKAGIFRAGRLALTGAAGEALEVLKREAEGRGTTLWALGEEMQVEGRSLGWEGVRFWVRCPAGEVEARSRLVGEHQIANLALAAAAALAWGASRVQVEEGLARATWPGRLERLPWRGRWLVFDGAHNAESAAALATSLAQLEQRPFTLLVGMGRDKDLPSLAGSLVPGAGKVIATASSLSPRARPATEVADAFEPLAVPVAEPAEALERAVAETPEGGTIVIAGSLYLVGELRPLVTGEELESEERWQ